MEDFWTIVILLGILFFIFGKNKKRKPKKKNTRKGGAELAPKGTLEREMQDYEARGFQDEDEIDYETEKKQRIKKLKKKKPAPLEYEIAQDELLILDEVIEKFPDDDIDVVGASGDSYTVNLRKMSCTCPDFIKRRKKFDLGDVRRICKHQAEVFIEKKLTRGKTIPDPRIKSLIRNPMKKLWKTLWRVDFNEKYFDDPEDRTFFIFDEESKGGWISVVRFTARSYKRGGFNLKEGRWSYEDNIILDYINIDADEDELDIASSKALLKIANENLNYKTLS